MHADDIILAARTDYLDDLALPYRWTDETLLRHLIFVYKEFCRETGILRDFSTASVCEHHILANKSTYATSSKITEIHNGYLTEADVEIKVKTDKWLSENYPGWRTATGGTPSYLIPDYNANFLRLVGYPSDDEGYWSGAKTFAVGGTITGVAADAFSNLLEAGDEVVISGTTLNGTTAVPATFTVVTAAAGSFTVSETVANEAGPAATIIQKITDTLWLTVSRLPITDITMANWTTESPEIREDYHPYLVFGICREAYSKSDSQTYNEAEHRKFREYFEYEKMKAKFETDSLRRGRQHLKPSFGSL
jgi:hypothetical protein